MQSSECIPKYGAEKGSGVRPISLVGSLYKIIKKMTTNRIEEVTKSIIGLYHGALTTTQCHLGGK